MRLTFYFLMFYSLLFNSIAQQENSPITSKYEIKTLVGISNYLKFYKTDKQWREAIPNLSIPDSFASSTDKHYDYGAETNFSMLFSFYLHNNTLKNNKLKTSTAFHFGLGSNIYSNRSWSYEKITIVDTMISMATGEKHYLKEMLDISYDVIYKANSFNIGIGQRISTNPERVFIFETGLDLIYYMSFNNRVSCFYKEKLDNNFPDSFTPPNSTQPYYIKSKEPQYYKGEYISGIHLLIPFDISFRLSKKINVLQNMRLGWEFYLGVNMMLNRDAQLLNYIKTTSAFNLRYRL